MGPQGPQGEKGDPGPKGDTGSPGAGSGFSVYEEEIQNDEIGVGAPWTPVKNCDPGDLPLAFGWSGDENGNLRLARLAYSGSTPVGWEFELENLGAPGSLVAGLLYVTCADIAEPYR